MPDKSLLLKYYLQRVITMIVTPKTPDTHKRRTRKVRRQAKCGYDFADHST